MTLIELEEQMRSIEHAHGSLFDHGQRVSKLIQAWGLSYGLCVAGVYHSIYGRDRTRFRPPVEFSERKNIQLLLGEKAERLIFLSCIYTPRSFWRCFHFDDCSLEDRTSPGRSIAVDKSELIELLHLSLANMLDHIPPALDVKMANFKWRELSLLVQHSPKMCEQARRSFLTKFKLAAG